MDTLTSKYASRTESEMNLNWAQENPALFVKTFVEFQDARPSTEWDHKIDLSRKGYATLIATRKPEATDINNLPATGSCVAMVSYDYKRLTDMLIDAFEGCSAYWCRELEYVTPGPQDKIAFESPIYSDPAFWRAGGRMVLKYDNPEAGPEFKTKSIGLVEMISGLNTMVAKYPHHAADFIKDNTDGETADTYLQCVVLGEIVYG